MLTFREWVELKQCYGEGLSGILSFLKGLYPVKSKSVSIKSPEGPKEVQERSYHNFLFRLAEELIRLGSPLSEVNSFFTFHNLSDDLGPVVKITPKARGLEKLEARNFNFDEAAEAAKWIDEILAFLSPLEEQANRPKGALHESLSGSSGAGRRQAATGIPNREHKSN